MIQNLFQFTVGVLTAVVSSLIVIVVMQVSLKEEDIPEVKDPFEPTQEKRDAYGKF